MSNHDYDLANLAGAAHRADLNNALAAIVSQNSGATEPATMFAYQWWADTSTGKLKIRNAANSAWVEVGTLASANLGLALLAGSASQVFSVAAGGATAAAAVRQDEIVGKNAIINGDFRVSQRDAVTLTSTPTYGLADRWLIYAVGGSAISGADAISSTNPGISSGKMYGTTSGSWTTGQFVISQRIEALNAFKFNSKPVTISCKVYQNTGASRNMLIQLVKANLADSFTAVTVLATSGNLACANGATTSISFTTSTLGASDATNGLAIYIYDSAANTVVSKTYLVGDVQMEVGQVATQFEPRPYAQELELCQWYYERMLATAAGERFAEGFFDSTTAVASTLNFKPKRIAPSISFSAATNFQARYSGGASAACSAISASAINKYGKAAVSGTVSVGSGVVGQGCLITAVNSNADIVISAELP